jgi:bla regulator protein BlaR1
MNAIDMLADTLLVRLAWTSAQATLLIGALWLLGRWMPRLPPAIRCMLWWLLAAQLLVGLLVSTPVRLPLLSTASHNVAIARPADLRSTATTPLAEPMAPSELATSSAPSTTAIMSTTTRPFHWQRLLLALWLAGLFVQLLLVARQWLWARTVLRGSVPLHDETLQALCAQQAQALGLRRCPQLRMSSAIASPQVAGLWRPVVLLPASQLLTPEESAMALAHEQAHLRRGDLWLVWVPAIAQRLFFFHPLVAWAMREYALNREAACDAQVLQQHRAAPQTYGRLLLRLGVAHPTHAGLAGASPTFQNLKRRLTMLQQTVNDTRPRARLATGAAGRHRGCPSLPRHCGGPEPDPGHDAVRLRRAGTRRCANAARPSCSPQPLRSTGTAFAAGTCSSGTGTATAAAATRSPDTSYRT